MDEKQEESTPFDCEWEIRKLERRIMDIMDIIDELKAKDKSLSARISRAKLLKLEEEEEEPEEEEEEVILDREIPLEMRVMAYANLLKSQSTQR